MNVSSSVQGLEFIWHPYNNWYHSLLSSSPLLLHFSQSELRRHDSELHGETLDAELEQFEQELMEGGDVTVDSKTDDDLMLEMEEFL